MSHAAKHEKQQQLLLHWKNKDRAEDSLELEVFPPKLAEEISGLTGLKVVSMFTAMPLVLMSGPKCDLRELNQKLHEKYDGTVTAEKPKTAIIQEYRGPMQKTR